MKKRGFSLAEVLVAMSIIAIAAALMVPAYTRFKPDRYKFRVLNAYKLILETNQTLLDNRGIYYRVLTDDPPYLSGTTVLDPSTQEGCIGFFCTERPTDTEFSDLQYTGLCKYPNLMREMLNLNNTSTCAETNPVISGTAPDTSLWTIENVFNDSNTGDIGYLISVDLNPRNTEAQSCSYSSTCTHPDIFTFFVDRNGDVDLNARRPNNTLYMDSLTRTYIMNMENIYKQQDFDQASGG